MFSLFFFFLDKSRRQDSSLPLSLSWWCLVSIEKELNQSVWMKVGTSARVCLLSPHPLWAPTAHIFSSALSSPTNQFSKGEDLGLPSLGHPKFPWWGRGIFPVLLSSLRVVNPNSSPGYFLHHPKVLFCSQTRRISAGLTVTIQGCSWGTGLGRSNCSPNTI